MVTHCMHGQSGQGKVVLSEIKWSTIGWVDHVVQQRMVLYKRQSTRRQIQRTVTTLKTAKYLKLRLVDSTFDAINCKF